VFKRSIFDKRRSEIALKSNAEKVKNGNFFIIIIVVFEFEMKQMLNNNQRYLFNENNKQKSNFFRLINALKYLTYQV
jgi:K+ transporter